MVPSNLSSLNEQRERLVVDLMRAIQLRTMVGLLREPDQVVDHELSEFIGEQPFAITGDVGCALDWARKITPELTITTAKVREYYRVDAILDGQPYFCGYISEIETLPICMVGLNRFIERTEKLLRTD